MAQVSYGTITITDTNDIERIYMEYAQSSSNSTAPTTGWSENIPAWEQGKYIWQRTVVKKEGIALSSDSYGDPVCLTGSTGSTGSPGATGRGVSSIVTTYCNYGTGTPAANYSGWSTTVPTYDSTKPNYWIKTVITYTSGTPATDTKIYQDNGITSATATAASAKTQAAAAEDKADTAVSTANTANTNASNALTIATGINQHFWTISTDYATGVPAGSYITDTAIDTFKSNKTGGNLLTRSDGIWIRNGVNTLTSLTGTALTFYNPSTSKAQLIIGANGILQSGNFVYTSGTYSDSGTKIDLTNGSIYTPGFRTDGSNTYIRGEVNALSGKIGNNSSNYWTIGNYYNYDQTASAALVSHGTAFIQLDTSNTWRLSTDRIHTAWNGTDGSAALMFPKDGDTYWDWGIHSPHKTNNVWKDKFVYARKYTNTTDDDFTNRDNLSNDIDDDLGLWTYQFYIDKNGSIYARNFYLLNADGTPGSNIGGQDAVYLLKTGGTISGNLEVNGTLTKGSKNVAYLSTTPTSGQVLVADGTAGGIKTSGYTIAKSVPSNAIFTDENVNTSQANTTKIYLTGTSTAGSSTGKLKFDSNVYLTTTAGTLHATTFEGNLSGTALRATADGDGNTISTTYLKLSGGNVTGAVSFGSSVSVDELTVGDLVVNGNASFTNNAQFNTINGVAVGSNPKFTDNNTTYTFANGTNGFTVTPSGGTAQTVIVTPSITNNVTGSGTNGYLTKWTGTNTIGNGPALGSDTTKFLNNKGEWAVPTGTYTYTLPLAANGTRGGVQIGYSANGKNYPVQLSNEKMYVNVPWTDNNTTYTIATGDSNGQIKVTPSSGNAYNVSVKGLGSAAFVNTSLFPIVSTYSLPAAKAVRIQYPTYAPVLISAQRSNGGGRLILLGGGYGAEGTVRNDFQEVVSSSTSNFTWTLPSSASISNSIEIMNVQTSGAATIIVWSSAAATFTEINALSNDAMNRVIVTSANYTDYTVTKTGSGASGTWGINITGTAANVTGTVAIVNGGTGKTTANDAINALLNGLPVWSANPTDTTYFIRQDTGGAASYGKVPATTLWNYISGKLPSWSKASSKPSYSYSEIGNAPDAIIGATVNEDGVIVLTKNSGGTIPLSTEIAVVESQGANKLVEAGSTTGISVGNAAEPVYFSAGVPVKGNTIPKLNNTTTGGVFYAPTSGGTANTQALVGNGATTAPKWVNISPSISITAGTSSATPKINVTVLGQSGTAQSLTMASTSVYGATKLSSTSSSTEQGLAATPKLVYDSIAALNVSAQTGAQSKTITSISETDGKISVTYSNISITKSQISDFPTSMTPAAHNHDDRYYTESEIDNKFTALTNTTTQINNIKFYAGSFNAGKTYIGWIKIASFALGNNNYIGENSYDFGIYRGYNSPASESYNLKVNTGWGNASIVQLNGKAGNQIIEKFRLVRDNTNHVAYFEVYVNTEYSTYQNNVNLRIQTWNGSTELTLLNTVQTEEDSAFQIISTIDLKPQGIVSNSNFYGNLIGNADTASTANAVAWGNVTNKPINFITNSGALNTNGWKTLGGRTSQNSIAISYASSSPATWNSESFSASIVFGCSDTKGMVDVGYNSSIVTFGGGSVNGSTDNAPKWYFKLSGTSGQTYTFPSSSKTLVATDGTGASGTWGISITGNAATASSATKATQDGDGNTISSTYLKLSGGTMAGPLKWNSTSLPQFSGAPSYLVGIDAFASGGTMKWQEVSQITVGAATKATQDASGNIITSTYVNKAGDTMSGTLAITATPSSSNYNEGIRINRGTGGYASLVIGGNANTTEGINDGAWWIGMNNGSYPRRLIIAHNGSGASATYFYSNASGTVSPWLHLGNSGTITSGNSDAVTGGVVYTAISNLSGTYVGLTGNEGILGTKVFGSGTSYGSVTSKTSYTEKANINYNATLDALVFSFA